MKKITVLNINELKQGDLIMYEDCEMLKYTGWNNGHIWEFNGTIFDDETDMDGHFLGDKIVKLTKNELIYHARTE